MKIISESVASEHREMLPQIIQRIFFVCKADKNFPLKSQTQTLDGKVSLLKSKVLHQMEIAKRSKKNRENLEDRINSLEDNNTDTRNQLLDFLGSE